MPTKKILAENDGIFKIDIEVEANDEKNSM